MAQGFDALVEFLAGKVAFRGEQGARRRDILPWIHEFYENSVSGSDANQPRRPLVDDDLADAVWSWLKHDDGLSFSKKKASTNAALQNPNGVPDGETSNGNGAVIDNDTALSPTSRQDTTIEEFVVADQHRMWLAIAGHDVDHKRLPLMHFQLLSIIAASGKTGVYQPQLQDLSGQDKRSIPARTDFLHQKGYIEKRAVIWGKMRTSWCVSKAFSGVETPPNKLGVDVKAMQARQMIEQTIPRLESSGEGSMLLIESIRQDLDIVGKRLARQTLNRAFNIMATFGWVKLYSVPTLTKGPQLKAIALLRTPSTDDLNTFERVFNDNAYLMNASVNKAAAEDRDANEDVDADSDEEEVAFSSAARADETLQLGQPPGVGAWRPDSPLPLQIFEQVDAAALSGIDAGDVSTIIGLRFCRKSVDQLFQRLAENWKSCQPSELRRFSVVRDVGLKYRAHHYIYRTFFNQILAVEDGTSTWSAVGGNKVANENVNLDENGFVPIVKRELLVRDAAAPPSHCLASFKPARDKSLMGALSADLSVSRLLAQDSQISRRRTSKKGVHVDTSNPIEALQALQAKLPEQKQWRDFVQQASKMASRLFERDTISKRDRGESLDALADAPPAKRVKFSRPTNDADQRASDGGQSGKRGLPDTPDESENPSTKKLKSQMDHRDQRALAELEMQFLMMTRPGAYINPPAKVPATRGRPKKRLILVLKSDKISTLASLADDTQDLESGQQGASRDVGKIFKEFQRDSEAAATGQRPKYARVAVIERTRLQREADSPLSGYHRLRDDTRSKTRAGNSSEVPPPAEARFSHGTQDLTTSGDNETSAHVVGDVNASANIQALGNPRAQTPAHNLASPSPGSRLSQAGMRSTPAFSEPQQSSPIGAFPLPNADRKNNPRKKRNIQERGFGAFSGGTMAAQRKEIIMHIINRNGGVYPGEREIGAAFAIEWQNRTGHDKPAPDTATATRVVKNLVDSGSLLRHYFTVDYRGAVKTKSVLSVPTISGSNEKVKAVQAQINAFHPKSYIPERELDLFDDSQGPASQVVSPSINLEPDGQIDQYNRLLAHRRSRTNIHRWHTMLHQASEANDARSEERMLAVAELEAETNPHLRAQQSNFPLSSYFHDPAMIWSRRGENDAESSSGLPETANSSMAWTASQALSRLTPAAGRFASRRMRNRFQVDPNAWTIQTDNQNGKVSTLTSPSQTLHQPSGTFSTDFSVELGIQPSWGVGPARELSSMEDRPWAHTEQQLARPEQPRSPQDHPFDQINAIGKWEIASLAERDKLPSSRDTVGQTSFVVHAMPVFGTKPIEVKEPDESRDRGLKLLENLKLQTLRRQLQTRTRDVSVAPVQRAERNPIQPKTARAHFNPPRPASRQSGPFSMMIRGMGPSRIIMGNRARPRGDSASGRGRPAEQVEIAVDETYRLATCVVVVQSLSGIKLEHLDWSLIGRLAGTARPVDARHKFKAVLAAKRAEVKQLKVFFQGAFLAAYERGEAPAAIHEDVSAMDWQAVVDWSMGRLDDWLWPDRATLIADRARLERSFAIRDSKMALANGPIAPRYLTMTKKRLEFHELSFHVPMRRKGRGSLLPDAPREVEVAKTFIRANIKTPEKSYDAKAAREKLRIFPEPTIDLALSELTKSKLLERKDKKNIVEGRNFIMPSALEDAYLRLTFEGYRRMFGEAARFKTYLDSHAVDEAGQVLPFGLSDGEMMALIEMFQAGRIRIRSILPAATKELTGNTKKKDNPHALAAVDEKRRLSVWGLAASSFQTLHMSNDKLIFPLRVTAGANAESDLAAPVQSQLNPAPTKLQKPHDKMIPLWRDINGSPIWETWSNILAGVATIVALRPGIGARGIAEMLDRKSAATEAEVEATLRWMLEQDLAVRHGAGYGVSEAWWPAVSASMDADRGASEALATAV